MQDYIDSVTIYPVFNQAFVSLEHPVGELEYPGDAIGRDFMAIKFVNGFARTYVNDGSRNEDWFGYMLDVLTPCDAFVERVNIVESVNTPGFHINKPAGSVTFLCDNNIRIVYAHLTEIRVKPNDKVVKGQHFAKCGNNGTSWHPHVHVGAWKDKQPLQIRVDLNALGKIQQDVGDAFYFLADDKKTSERFHQSFKK
jgi:hypothetical protein